VSSSFFREQDNQVQVLAAGLLPPELTRQTVFPTSPRPSVRVKKIGDDILSFAMDARR
jgi:hypothetical protein